MITEKLSDKDVELMGYVKDSVFFAEVLFTKQLLNHESLKNFSDDSFAEIRLYQLPYMSYEYLLAEDPDLTDEENFQNKQSCGRCYAYTGRKTGKCEFEENNCNLADGSLVKFKDLKGKIAKTLSLNNKYKIVESLSYFKDNGVQPCHKIITRTNKEKIVTSNHSFLTSDGWKEIKDIAPGDYIAMPRKISDNLDEEINNIANSDIFWEEVKSVEYVGTLPTVAVQTKEHRNYISDGFISHNTLIALLVDLLLDTVHHCTDWVTLVASFDDDHVANVCEPYITTCKSHPFFKLFGIKSKAKPYRITTPTGHLVKGINMNLGGREQGAYFESQHGCKIVIDEHQYETMEVVKKRSQATSEYGTIERFVGITAFTQDSPAGNIFFNIDRKNWLVNLPQTVSPAWTPTRKAEAIADYGDESSPAYKIHVKAEVIQDMEGVYDIERLRKCVAENTKVLMADFSQKNIQDIVIGDEVLGFEEFTDSKYLKRKFVKSTVTSKTFMGVKDTLLFKSGQNKLEATFDHLAFGFTSINKNTPLWYNLKQIALKNGLVYNMRNLIKEKIPYLWGVLLGFIDSDGQFKYSYRITQKTERKALEWILKELSIKYNTYIDKRSNACEFLFGKANNDAINSYFDKLESNKDVQIGYAVGMILGDGTYSHDDNCFIIAQKRVDKTNKIRHILEISNIKFTENYNKKFQTYTFRFPGLELMPYIKNSKKVNHLNKMLFKKSTLRKATKEKLEIIGKNKTKVWDIGTTSGTFIANGILVHNCYFPKNKNKPIKHFEFHKDDKLFDNGVLDVEKLKRRLVVERPPNATLTYLASDFGENISEIVVIFETEHKHEESTFKYVYNISLYKMTPDEQTEIFKYLIIKLQAEMTGIDCSESGGKQIYRNLNKIYPAENLHWVSFQEKIDVDVKKDEKGRPIKNAKGEWEYEREFITDWSIARLKKIFYEQRIDCLYDLKLDKEFNNMVCIKRIRQAYTSKINQDHLHQSFQVFAIMEWKKTFCNRTKPKRKEVNWGTGVCSK